jgi:hypothetical protein
LLQQASIPVILLKGIDTAKRLYADTALRPMVDMDLLVRRKDLDQAAELFSTIGFRELPRDSQLNFPMDSQHNYHLENENHLNLELHWSLISGEKDWRAPNEDWAWVNVEKAASPAQEGLNALCLNPNAALLYSSAHLALQHGLAFSRLVWLYDVHLLVNAYRDRLDWEDLVNQAKTLGWESALSAALGEVQNRFGTSLPEAGLVRLNSDASKDTRLVQRKATTDSLYEHFVMKVSSLDRNARMKFILAGLFPSPAYIRARYHPRPVWIWMLYYPYRWLSILFNLVRMILKRIMKS